MIRKIISHICRYNSSAVVWAERGQAPPGILGQEWEFRGTVWRLFRGSGGAASYRIIVLMLGKTLHGEVGCDAGSRRCPPPHPVPKPVAFHEREQRDKRGTLLGGLLASPAPSALG